MGVMCDVCRVWTQASHFRGTRAPVNTRAASPPWENTEHRSHTSGGRESDILRCLTIFDEVVQYTEKVLPRSSMTGSFKDLWYEGPTVQIPPSPGNKRVDLHGSSYDTITVTVTVLYIEIEINVMTIVMTPGCLVCHSQLTNTVPWCRSTLNTSVPIRNGPILYTRNY